MNARYVARRGGLYWYVHDRVLNDEANWAPGAEVECGIPDDCPGYTEAQARAVADWLNQHDTTHPDDIPADQE